MKIIVCGGRSFYDYRYLDMALEVIDQQRVISHLVHGDANGADRLAAQWALYREINCTPYPADWGNHKLGAGPIRNRVMMETNKDAAYLVAFPGDRGTKDMMNVAKAAGCPTIDLRTRPTSIVLL